MADEETASTARTVYQSRGQQWIEVTLDSPEDATVVSRRHGGSASPISAVNPLGSDLEIGGYTGRSPVDVKKMAMESAPGQQYRAFRGLSGNSILAG